MAIKVGFETFTIQIVEGTPHARRAVLHIFTLPVLRERANGLQWTAVQDETLTVRNPYEAPLTVFAEFVMPPDVQDFMGIVTQRVDAVGVQVLDVQETLTLTMQQGQMVFSIKTPEGHEETDGD